MRVALEYLAIENVALSPKYFTARTPAIEKAKEIRPIAISSLTPSTQEVTSTVSIRIAKKAIAGMRFHRHFS